MKKITEIISALALLVALVSAVYARHQAIAAEEQVQIAKQSYEASVEQLALARKAQQTSEANYKLSLDQLELQKNVVATDSRFQVVIGADSDENLESTLENGKDVSFSLVNGSKNAVAYHVVVRTEGIGLNWSGQQPSRMYYVMSLDKRPIVVQPNEPYRRTFSVWVGKTPAPNARIGIYVNEALVLEYNYTYDLSSNTYVFRRS